MGKKKKKPSWPIWVGAAMFVLIIVVFLTDWERYPKKEEMERYLEASSLYKVDVKVVEMDEQKDAYDEAMVYRLEYHFEDGDVEHEAYTVRKKDRKAVYPWHDYYRGMYPVKTEE